jgi:rRNA-processing protein FCF1
MRIVYLDETGTAPPEQVRIVAGIIVEADQELAALDAQLSALIEASVPEQLRDGFYLHAKDIANGRFKDYDGVWAMPDRREFIIAALNILRDTNIPIVCGTCFKDAISLDRYDAELAKSRTRRDQVEHAIAFGTAVNRADWFIERYLQGKEKAIVIAEDHDLRRRLRPAGLAYRGQEVAISQKPSADDIDAGVKPADAILTLKHIIDVPHFVPKLSATIPRYANAPMLQFADLLGFKIEVRRLI